MADSNQQIQEIVALYLKTDISNEAQQKALSKLISESMLPRYHKEVMTAAFLEPDSSTCVSLLYLLKQQEILRHADALMKFEQQVIASRTRKAKTKK